MIYFVAFLGRHLSILNYSLFIDWLLIITFIHSNVKHSKFYIVLEVISLNNFKRLYHKRNLTIFSP